MTQQQAKATMKSYSRQSHKRKAVVNSKLLPIGALITLITWTALLIRNSLTPWNESFHLLNHGRSMNDEPVKASLRRLKHQPAHRQTNITNNLNSRRQDFERACLDLGTSKNLDDIQWELERQLASFFMPPPALPDLDKKDPVQPCMFTFIDLGANIGDSLGKFIDAGFPFDCPALEKTQSRAKYSIEDGIVALSDGGVTDLSDFVRARLEQQSLDPEDYCYVGVEGNPVFTSTLQELEARVMGTIPKPIHAAHFYTETVAAGTDGPTVLYLDTVNEDHNFWGSSLVRTHTDVQKSAADNGDSPIEAKVMGVTLSTLLKRSLKRERGAHVIIKIDIEGGEYRVMNEAIDTLCDYKSSGVQIDLILETHSNDVLGGEQGGEDFVVFQRETRKRMKACGILSGLLSPKLGQ